MFKGKSKWLLVVALFGGLLAVVGLADLAYKNLPLASVFQNQKAEVNQESQQPVYSFYKDDDVDGLSNGWEYVFGSSAEKADTDGDGYGDKEEVDNGYDPLISGEKKGRLEERKSKNLSIDYYLWAKRNKIQEPDPEDLSKIQAFANKNSLLSVSKPSVDKISLNPDDSQQSLEDYFSQLDQVSFPQAAFDYQSLAENYSEKTQSQLDDLISRVDLALADLRKLSPPKQALTIQQNYLTILETFRFFLEDLKRSKQDPVRIKVNILKAPELIELAIEAETLKAKLLQ